MEDINIVSGEIIGAAMRIHTSLGPGVLESVYERVLARDLARKGFDVVRQKKVTFEFEGMVFEDAFRADIVVNNLVVVEVKAVERLDPIHRRQLQTYLVLLGCPSLPAVASQLAAAAPQRC